jgi:hypothetical protein
VAENEPEQCVHWQPPEKSFLLDTPPNIWLVRIAWAETRNLSLLILKTSQSAFLSRSPRTMPEARLEAECKKALRLSIAQGFNHEWTPMNPNKAAF